MNVKEVRSAEGLYCNTASWSCKHIEGEFSALGCDAKAAESQSQAIAALYSVLPSQLEEMLAQAKIDARLAAYVPPLPIKPSSLPNKTKTGGLVAFQHLQGRYGPAMPWFIPGNHSFEEGGFRWDRLPENQTNVSEAEKNATRVALEEYASEHNVSVRGNNTVRLAMLNKGGLWISHGGSVSTYDRKLGMAGNATRKGKGKAKGKGKDKGKGKGKGKGKSKGGKFKLPALEPVDNSAKYFIPGVFALALFMFALMGMKTLRSLGMFAQGLQEPLMPTSLQLI